MKIQGIVGIVVVILLVIAAILVGNLFFSKILGVDVGALPPFFKFIVHLTGAAFIAFAAKKLFVK